MYVRKEKIYPAYVSKHNSNSEKQVILLMIPDREEWHYLAVKKLSALLRGITSKNSFRIKNKLESQYPISKI